MSLTNFFLNQSDWHITKRTQVLQPPLPKWRPNEYCFFWFKACLLDRILLFFEEVLTYLEECAATWRWKHLPMRLDPWKLYDLSYNDESMRGGYSKYGLNTQRLLWNELERLMQRLKCNSKRWKHVGKSELLCICFYTI